LRHLDVGIHQVVLQPAFIKFILCHVIPIG
jgi:hypothetical protein